MVPEHIMQQLKPKQGQYTLNRKESFIDKQRRLSEIERQSVVQKKQKEMQLFRQTFSSSKLSYSSKPGMRIMIKARGGGQAIPLEEYHKCITSPNVGKRHQQSMSQSLPRIDTEQAPQFKQEPEQIVEPVEEIESQEQNEQIQDEDHQECVPEQHLSDYQAFMLHLTGKCICAQCPIGQCKCKFDYQSYRPNISWKSHYNQEYKPVQTKDQELKMDLNAIGQYQAADPGEFKTTMASDYRQFDVPPPEHKERSTYRPSLGATPITSYNKFYMDYGDLHYEQFKQSHYKTVIPELKFSSQTTYSNEFKRLQQTETPSQKPANGKPFPTIDLFLGQSQNKKTYDVKTPDKCYQVKSMPEPVLSTPAFDKQFLSVARKDYPPKRCF